jgi:hypothetical protein
LLATPIRYEALVKDIMLHNLVDYRRQAVLQDQIPKSEAAAAGAAELADAVQNELKKGL